MIDAIKILPMTNDIIDIVPGMKDLMCIVTFLIVLTVVCTISIWALFCVILVYKNKLKDAVEKDLTKL